MMMNADDIMDKIGSNLKQNCHATVVHSDIEKKCASVKKILLVLNTISSYTKRAKVLSDDDIILLRRKVKELGKLWRDDGLSVTPKFHILECHYIDVITKYRVLGLFSEVFPNHVILLHHFTIPTLR